MTPENFALKLSAVDTLMFRDGRPFNQNDAGASQAATVFPPHPPTIVGAIRAMLWDILGDWDEDILGNGTNWQKDSLGRLSFSAPLVLSVGKAFFPMPLHILGNKAGLRINALTRLRPGTVRETDLGSARLPETDGTIEGAKPLSEYWVNAAAMTDILKGSLPDKADLKAASDLWSLESRVGIGLDRESRRPHQSQLYMASHARPAAGTGIYVKVAGFAQPDAGLRPLGGEHRMAEVTEADLIDSPASPKMKAPDKYCVILLSPLVLTGPARPGEPLGDLPGRIISACIGKPLKIGGWDSTRGKPVPLKETVPAGSVFFMEGDSALAAQRHLSHIGGSTAWGFGQVLIGNW